MTEVLKLRGSDFRWKARSVYFAPNRAVEEWLSTSSTLVRRTKNRLAKLCVAPLTLNPKP